MMRLGENAKVVKGHTPVSVSPGTVLSAAIDTFGFDGLLVVVESGTLGASATLDVKVTECDTSGGTYTDVTGAAITQMTKAGGDDDKVATIDVRLGERANRKRFIKISATVGVAASVFATQAILYNPEQPPITNSPATKFA